MRERPQEKGGSNQDPRDRGERELVWCQRLTRVGPPASIPPDCRGEPGPRDQRQGVEEGRGSAPTGYSNKTSEGVLEMNGR